MEFLSRTKYLFQPGSAALRKIFKLYYMLHRKVLEVNDLFHAETTIIYSLQKCSPPWRLNNGPLNNCKL